MNQRKLFLKVNALKEDLDKMNEEAHQKKLTDELKRKMDFQYEIKKESVNQVCEVFYLNQDQRKAS